MQSTKKFTAGLFISLASCLLVACAARPVLISKSAIVPAGTDLSGQWQLHIEPGSRSRPPAGDEQNIRIPPPTSSRNRGREAQRIPRGSRSSAVSVFLESGDALKITQTASGLFISFDRAIVEEYRFGENRLVSVGPIEAQRVSGWQEGRFVTETLDEAGAILSETWELLAGGKVLVRTISLAAGDDEGFSSVQRFDRL